jgi:hypothetical protein
MPIVRSLLVALALGQLPPAGVLSETDKPLFHAELTRVEKLLTSPSDKSTVTYQIARTWASAQQWHEAIEWLQKAIALKAGFDPSRDPVFSALRNTKEFEAILTEAIAATPPVSRSTPAFQISEGDLVPESVAWDPNNRQFYFGSEKKGRVLRCSATGDCAPFATGLGVVLGLKVHADGLWLLNNSDQESALIHYDLASAKEVRRYKITGPGHTFNDLTIAPNGEIYLTDTPAAAVWYMAKGSPDLTKLPGRFEFANGIARSQDAKLLYVSTFPDGITVVDLKTGKSSPIVHPAGLCLATIDGLYVHHGALIAIQNGFMAPRVVRLTLTPDRRGIARFEILERRNPLFEGVTTGVIAGTDFFYMANIQDDKQTGFNPITILRLRL